MSLWFLLIDSILIYRQEFSTQMQEEELQLLQGLMKLLPVGNLRVQ